ncbi:MAG: PLP-dependent aminotransferase family protein [Tepidimonas ignava]|nr:PLP-dependent aminotransferase family protein [Tepidimonas ignava]
MTLSTSLLAEHLLAELARDDGPAGPHSGLPLNRRLYEALRRTLLDGRLGPGERLPSSRELAADLRLSRNTVVAALEQLTAEGYLSSRVGSGTYVADWWPQGTAPRPRRAPSTARLPGLSARGQTLARRHNAQRLEIQPFTPGAADFSAFPVAVWQRLHNKHWRQARPDMLDYTTSGGYGPLRRAVADYLRVSRSVRLEPEQVIITSGTQQSLELCARLLADVGERVWIEDPAYWGAVKALQACGLELQPLPVDEQGWTPPQEGSAGAPRLIYVTPSHQYPTGAVLSLARRRALLALAARLDAWVLEDDYDSEFRFDGAPIASLAGLDDDGRVCYLGTFSKVLYPGIKLGYLVAPRALVEDFRQAHYDLNRPGQLPLQAALAEFIELGHFAAALRRARQTYAQRRQQLLAALQPLLALPGVRIDGAAQGLHLCLRLPAHADDGAMATQLAREGITVRPLSAYCLQRRDLRGLVIGYGYAQPALIAPCAARVVAVVRQALG